MSGGVLYQRIQPQMNLTVDAIRRRIAQGATVDIYPLDDTGISDVLDLLGGYIQTLEANNQPDEVGHLYALLHRPQDYFVMVAPPSRIKAK
jgi:glutamate synthase (NADPH/NADH) large chain